MKKIYILLISIAFSTLVNAQELIHYWNFNNSESIETLLAPTMSLVQGAVISEEHSTEADGIQTTGNTGQDFADVNARLEEAAGSHLRFNTPINGTLFFTLPTTGYEDVKVSYSTRRSGSGPDKQTVWYTINGSDYIEFQTIDVTETPTLIELDFSAITEASNNADFGLRFTFGFEVVTGTAGNNRFDNFAVDANLAPVLVHYWNFNDGTTRETLLAPNVSLVSGATITDENSAEDGGIRTADQDGITGQSFSDINVRLGEEAGSHLRFNTPIAGNLTFALPTTGFRSIVVQYATRRSGSGPDKQTVWYTTNGIDYTEFTVIDVTETPELVRLDFSSMSEVNNNPDFGLRFTFGFEAVSGTAGNNRFDNFSVEQLPSEPVASISTSPSTAIIAVGTTQQIEATVLPINAANKNVTWSSSDEAIATVDANGLVTAITDGIVTITATTVDGGFEAISEITISTPFTITIIVKNNSDALLADIEVMFAGETYTTNEQGEITVSIVGGSYEASVEAVGYRMQERTIAVTGTMDVEFILVPVESAAGLVHYWHFNTLPSGTLLSPIIADYTALDGVTPGITYAGEGDGYMDRLGAGSPIGVEREEPAGSALRVRNPAINRELIIDLPTTGCSNIALAFDVHRSNNGMVTNIFTYTLDGTNYINTNMTPTSIDPPALIVNDLGDENPTESYEQFFIDFTAVTGANNNPNFKVKIVWDGMTDRSSGNNRYDNITLFKDVDPNTLSVNNAFVNRSGFVAYPNPANSLVHLNESTVFKVYNIAGEQVYQGDSNQFNVSNFTKGLYLIKTMEGKVTQLVVE